MRRTTLLAFTAAIAMTIGTPAQTPAPGAVSGAIKQNWDNAKRNMRESAAQMDEANYAFRPVTTVRTFGEILAHVAGASYVFCAAAKGQPSPFAEDHFEKSARGKAAIVKALDDAIVYCDATYGALTDASAAETVAMPFDMGKGARSNALIMNIGHLQEHYGNLVTYFRIKGMVPPTSRAR